MVQKIVKLKKELNAIILAHNYQPPKVQDVADFIGDSLELSIKASEVNAKLIVFCGVDFMAEQAAAINEEAIVLHPDPEASCPMATMISVEDVRKARKQYPKVPIVIYVNSPASVKAEADYVVTSANAVDVVKVIEADTVIFGPDRYLAEYVAEKTGKRVIPIPENGHCPIHIKFDLNTIQMLKSIYRNCLFIAHPECPGGVRALADFVGSTGQMIRFVKSSQSTCFLVGTEIGIIYRMARETKGKSFVPASTSAICEDMKKITLEKVYRSLRDGIHRVEIDRETAAKMRRALENTLMALGVELPWPRR